MSRKISLKDKEHLQNHVFPALLHCIQHNNDPNAVDLFMHTVLHLYIKHCTKFHPLTIFTDPKELFVERLELSDGEKIILQNVPKWFLYTYLETFEHNIEYFEKKYKEKNEKKDKEGNKEEHKEKNEKKYDKQCEENIPGVLCFWKRIIPLSPKKLSHKKVEEFQTNLEKLHEALKNPDTVKGTDWYPRDDDRNQFEELAKVYECLVDMAERASQYDGNSSIIPLRQDFKPPDKQLKENPALEIFAEIAGQQMNDPLKTINSKSDLMQKLNYLERKILEFILTFYAKDKNEAWKELQDKP